MAVAESPHVYDYVDYRSYLRDYCAHMQRVRPRFSQRSFVRRAGLGSPAGLQRVMNGEANLTPQLAQRCADAIGLTAESADYFVQLVRLNQIRSLHKAGKLESAHAAYHSRWYVPAVRELAAREDFRADAKWIARRLLPPITPKQAKSALETLLELGLLTRDGHGNVVQSTPLLTTGPEARAPHIARYHRMMMRKASESIDRVPADERDISAVSVLVGEGGMVRIKSIVQRFRRELLEVAVSERNPTQVIQTNVQVFPLSVARAKEPTK